MQNVTKAFKEAGVRWGRTRNRRAFWIALPSLVAGIGLLLTFFAGNLQSAAKLKVEYRKAATEALGTGAFRSANIYYRKLIRLGQANEKTLLEAALAAERVGNRAEKEALLVRLTKPGSGYAPAHRWIARDLLSQPGKDNIKRARVHLDRALDLEPDDPEANFLSGQLDLNEESYTDSVTRFRIAAKTIPQAKLLLATTYRHMGEEAMARSTAEETAAELRRRLENETEGENRARQDWTIQLAEAQIFLGRFEEALDTLNSERRRNPAAAEALGRPLTGVYLAWHDGLWAESPPQIKESLRRLNQAFRLSPRHTEVIQRLAALAGYRDPDRELPANLAKELLTAGIEPFLIHFISGAAAARTGDLEASRSHLDICQRIDPRTPEVLVSLATLESAAPKNTEPSANPDLPLRLVEEAIRLQPDDARFREARGRLHFHSGQWENAAREFESLLKIYPERPDLHISLATSYEKLGKAEEAEHHRRRARELATH